MKRMFLALSISALVGATSSAQTPQQCAKEWKAMNDMGLDPKLRPAPNLAEYLNQCVKGVTRRELDDEAAIARRQQAQQGVSPVGQWRSESATITITTVQTNYVVTISCPGCMGVIGGTFVGPYQNNMIMIQSPMGVVTYNSARDMVSYGGFEWQRER